MNDDLQRETSERELAAAWRDAVARDARESPPPALDAAIVAAARTAVRPRRPRYLVPVALAASLVVAVGLGLRHQREIAPVATPEMSSAPVAAEAAAPMEHARDVDAAVAPAASDRPAPPPLRERASVDAKAELADEQEARAAPPAGLREDDMQSAPAAVGKAMAPQPSEAARAEFATQAAAPDPVVARIRALLAAGDPQAAAALARDYVSRSPPGALPADLEFLLAPDKR